MTRYGTRRGHPDDYDDQGNYQPGPNPTYPRFTRCQPGCCTGTPLCHYPEEGDTDDHPTPLPD